MMSGYPIWLNLLIFAVASALIWWAGSRLERTADRISNRTGLGQAFTGMLLLAAATSLPELATTFTAIVILQNPTLAVHNLLGGVALQTAIIAVADAAKGERGALTFFTPKFVLLIEGVGLILLLQITLMGITTQGSPTVLSVSVWLILLFIVYIAVMYLIYRYRGEPRWTPTPRDDSPEELASEPEGPVPDSTGRSLQALVFVFAGYSLLVMGGGWAATETAEALAENTGLGSAFMGATLLAAATSLPEVSTTVAATRRGRHVVAISNVFGSNAFDIVLLFFAELLYRGGSILQDVDLSVAFVAVIGGAMTCVYLWGLMERENRTILGIGWDSAVACVIYIGGMVALYFDQ